jgi:hypothetical protein
LGLLCPPRHHPPASENFILYTSRDIGYQSFVQKGLTARRYREVGGPEGQVVSQELHDQGAIFVRLLSKGVQLWDSLIKRLQRTVGKEQNSFLIPGK